MTKADLIKKLAPYPDHMDVVLVEKTSDFAYGSIESVTSEEIDFQEEPGGKSLAKDTVIILSDEI